MSKNESIDNQLNLGQPDGDECSTAISEARSRQQKAFEQAAAAIVSRESPGAGQSASFGVEIRNLGN